MADETSVDHYSTITPLWRAGEGPVPYHRSDMLLILLTLSAIIIAIVSIPVLVHALRQEEEVFTRLADPPPFVARRNVSWNSTLSSEEITGTGTKDATRRTRKPRRTRSTRRTQPMTQTSSRQTKRPIQHSTATSTRPAKSPAPTLPTFGTLSTATTSSKQSTRHTQGRPSTTAASPTAETLPAPVTQTTAISFVVPAALPVTTSFTTKLTQVTQAQGVTQAAESTQVIESTPTMETTALPPLTDTPDVAGLSSAPDAIFSTRITKMTTTGTDKSKETVDVAATVLTTSHELGTARAVGTMAGNTTGTAVIARDKAVLEQIDFDEIITDASRSRLRTNADVCDTADCRNIAWLYTNSIRRSLDPCENFYEYVCSPYRKNIIEDLSFNLSQNIRSAFLNVSLSPNQQSALQKAVGYYRSCIAVDTQRSDNLRILKSFLSENRLSFITETYLDPVDVILRLLLLYDLSVFFTLKVEARDLDHGEPLFRIEESPSFQVWRLNRNHGRVTDDDLRIEVTELLESLRIKTLRSAQFIVDKILEAEKTIFAVRSEDNAFHIASCALSAFLKGPDVNSRWQASLSTYSHNVLPGSFYVRYGKSVPFFLSGVFGRVNKRYLNAYIAWDVAKQLLTAARLNRKGITDGSPVLGCYDRTLATFQHAVAVPYLYSVVNHTRLASLYEMIVNLKNKIAAAIESSNWLDRPTSSSLATKLRALQFQVGYPAGLETVQAIDSFYSEYPEMNGSFLQSFLNATSAQMRTLLFLVAHDATDLLRFPVGVLRRPGIFVTNNILYISAGTSLSPLFNDGGPQAINYGALGGAIAYEMMRTFHGSARLRDETGKPLSWTAKSISLYEERSSCYEESVRNTRNHGQPQPLRRKYKADIMASTSLYEAYKAAAARASRHMKIKDMEWLSDDQIFYISRCIPYCTSMSSITDTSYPTGPHRCNVPASNTPNFAAAFRCPSGSPMNPYKKCEFW